jgi:hypothetical protein
MLMGKIKPINTSATNIYNIIFLSIGVFFKKVNCAGNNIQKNRHIPVVINTESSFQSAFRKERPVAFSLISIQGNKILPKTI